MKIPIPISNHLESILNNVKQGQKLILQPKDKKFAISNYRQNCDLFFKMSYFYKCIFKLKCPNRIL